jgi:hypothetical protein
MEMNPIDKDDWRLETNGEETFRGMRFTLKRLALSSAVTWDPDLARAPPQCGITSTAASAGRSLRSLTISIPSTFKRVT